MQQSILLILLALLGCQSQSKNVEGDNSYMNDLDQLEILDPVCPQGNHKDSIIEIIYGEPSEELFEEADSGLVYLGGCELMDDNWYCKKHNITFE